MNRRPPPRMEDLLMLAKPEHQVAYDDLIGLLRKHADKMSKEDILAVAANMLGKIIALQDQRITPPERAMKIVSRNMTIGNRDAIEMVLDTKGSA